MLFFQTLIILLILTNVKSGPHHNNMKDFVFKYSPKKWFNYVRKLLVTSLLRARSLGSMMSQNIVTSYLIKRTLGIAKTSTIIVRQKFKISPISISTYEIEFFQKYPRVTYSIIWERGHYFRPVMKSVLGFKDTIEFFHFKIAC